MKIIPPYQITGEILNLINEAEKYLIIVSPYVNFKNWERIKFDILNAMNRGVKIEFYVRLDKDNSNSWEQVEELNLKPKLIKNLHAKLYFNESSGIVTSMNLLTSSNLSAIEFGAVYQTEKELIELKTYVKKYLEPYVESSKPNEEDLYVAKERFSIVLANFLSNKFERYVNTRWIKGSLEFNVNNKYYLFVDKGSNLVEIGGIISNREFENFVYFKEKNKYDSFEVKASQSCLYLSSNFKISSSNLNLIKVAEKKRLIEITAKFVEDLTQYKNECRDRQ